MNLIIQIKSSFEESIESKEDLACLKESMPISSIERTMAL